MPDINDMQWGEFVERISDELDIVVADVSDEVGDNTGEIIVDPQGNLKRWFDSTERMFEHDVGPIYTVIGDPTFSFEIETDCMAFVWFESEVRSYSDKRMDLYMTFEVTPPTKRINPEGLDTTYQQDEAFSSHTFSVGGYGGLRSMWNDDPPDGQWARFTNGSLVLFQKGTVSCLWELMGTGNGETDFAIRNRKMKISIEYTPVPVGEEF